MQSICMLSPEASTSGSQTSSTGLSSPQQQAAETCITTFMVRSLPRSMNRHDLERLLDSEGFAGGYDFIYLPADLKAGGCFGYGFINLVCSQAAEHFAQHFHGYVWTGAEHSELKSMAVHVSEALQGQEQLIQRYRNSPLMHGSVPQGQRPAIYCNGVEVSFPPPTERIRPPRVRETQKVRCTDQAAGFE